MWGLPKLNIGALEIRIGFWGPLYDNYNKEPLNKISVSNIKAPIVSHLSLNLRPIPCRPLGVRV